jgi:hypothetical protein
VTRDEEGAGWSLIDLAKQVFGAQNTAKAGFDFVETNPAIDAEGVRPTSPASEVAVVEQGEPAAAETRTDFPHPTNSPPSLSIRETKEVLLAAQRDEATSKKGRPFRTATEMAAIILNVLRAIDGVPEQGFVVTVYGTNPWNAMLTITPEAGRIKDAQLWRERVQDIGARLRQEFDILHEHRPLA